MTPFFAIFLTFHSPSPKLSARWNQSPDVQFLPGARFETDIN
ncbi:hypothetical protein AB13_4714 [Escherichia coli 1-250-04_S1_C1]|nr:hypothetical protein AB13_4714 [Escherichia coli 1-250-04_S1_C1]